MVLINVYLSRQEGRTNLISKFISLIYNVQIFGHMARGPPSLHLLWASQMSGVGVIPVCVAGLFKEQMTQLPVHKPRLSLSSLPAPQWPLGACSSLL